MMMKFINSITGNTMWVADNRAGEYIAAGHRPAASFTPVKPALAEKMEELTAAIRKVDPEKVSTKEPAKKPSVKKTTKKITKK